MEYMTNLEVIAHYWPAWLFGILMYATARLAGYSYEVRVEKAAIIYWIKYLLVISFIRVMTYILMGDLPFQAEAAEGLKNVNPLSLLGTPWEDFAFSLPLYFLGLFVGDSKVGKALYGIAVAVVLISFGFGHVYQGVFAAVLLSSGPSISLYFSKRYGWGSVGICHMLYDLMTLATMKVISII